MSKPFVFFDDVNSGMWCAELVAGEVYIDFPTWREAFDYAYLDAISAVEDDEIANATKPTEYEEQP